MKTPQVTMFELSNIFDFLEVHLDPEAYQKFLDLVATTSEKVGKPANTIITRLTNDALTVNGFISAVKNKEGIFALPLPEGVFFYNILEIEDCPAGSRLAADTPYKTKALVFIVVDTKNNTVEDQTHNLVD